MLATTATRLAKTWFCWLAGERKDVTTFYYKETASSFLRTTEIRVQLANLHRVINVNSWVSQPAISPSDLTKCLFTFQYKVKCSKKLDKRMFFVRYFEK
jgi:hypothetical protein